VELLFVKEIMHSFLGLERGFVCFWGERKVKERQKDGGKNVLGPKAPSQRRFLKQDPGAMFWGVGNIS